MEEQALVILDLGIDLPELAAEAGCCLGKPMSPASS